MSLTIEEVTKIAQLARIAVRPEDMAGYAQNLSNIFHLMDQMNAVNIDGVEPMAHPQELTARMRADEVTELDWRERFQALAPQTEAGLYLVPKVIE